ncbi:hypothetical protein HRbin39_01382 [bacterium HR39]|nr:hypothetical protein HRbin39_01382 [bacterium HR39]
MQLDEEALNLSVRKFLKIFGVTAQRELERAVREAVAAGRIAPDARLPVRAVVRVDALGLDFEVTGELRLS